MSEQIDYEKLRRLRANLSEILIQAEYVQNEISAMLAAREPAKEPTKDVFSAIGMEQPPFPTVKKSLTVQPDQFEREVRYIVNKVKDAKKYLSEDDYHKLILLSCKVDQGRITDDKHPMQCVVVESDWPEYETVWGMIEARMQPDQSIDANEMVPDWLQDEYSKAKGQAFVNALYDWIGGDMGLSLAVAATQIGFPPLPDHLPPVPENGVHLGYGPLEFTHADEFSGWRLGRKSHWEQWQWAGNSALHYCADLSAESGRRAAWYCLKSIKEGGERED